MAKDWFRKKSWSPQDEADFFACLKKARGQGSKAQYLRIQAVELLEVQTEENTRAAMALLQLLLKEYPERFEMASAFASLGECYERQGRDEDALSCYRKALDQQRAFRGVQTNAYLRFALLVSVNRRQSEYREALSILDEWGTLDKFPIITFEICAARAMIYHDKGELGQATESAYRALEAVAATHSGFRNHPKLGLVSEKQRKLVQQMEIIVNR